MMRPELSVCNIDRVSNCLDYEACTIPTDDRRYRN
jgi:hypothetical protein